MSLKGATTLSIKTPKITAHSIVTFNLKTLTIMTLSLTIKMIKSSINDI